MNEYEAQFDRCAQWIEPSLAYCNGTFTLVDLKIACLAGKMQLWPGERSALISEIVIFPQRIGCNVAFGGGDMDELKQMAPRMMAWAKKHGCDHITVQGRAGWVRALGFGRIVSTVASEDL